MCIAIVIANSLTVALAWQVCDRGEGVGDREQDLLLPTQNHNGS